MVGGFPAALLILVVSAGGGMVARQEPAPEFESLSRQAIAARDANRLDEALALFRRALELRPDWGEGWWSVGSIAYDKDDYSECAPAFRRLTRIKPDDAPAWTMLGLCEYGRRDYGAAFRSLLETERLRFQEVPELARSARLHLGMLLTRAGDFERAIVVLTRASQMDPRRPDAAVACGIAGLRKPWLPFEVPEADRDMVFRLGSAMIDAMTMQTQSATEKFEALLRDRPGEPNIHFRFGAFLMQQNTDRGIEEFKRALSLDPAHVPALVSLAMNYLKRDDLEAAKGYAERAVKAGGDDFATHLAEGRVLLATGDAAGAARELEAAVKQAPRSPAAHFSLAEAYRQLGRKTEAARELAEFQNLKKAPKP